MRNQKELRAELHRHGLNISQPVLSRDLRAIGVAKHGGQYQILNDAPATPLATLQPLLRDVDRAAHLVIVRCEPGAASAVARAIDAEDLPGVAGTVAGDDTIFIAVASRAAARKIHHHISEYL